MRHCRESWGRVSFLESEKTSREEDDGGCDDQKPQGSRQMCEWSDDQGRTKDLDYSWTEMFILSWMNRLYPNRFDYPWDIWRCLPALTRLEDTRDITGRDVSKITSFRPTVFEWTRKRHGTESVYSQLGEALNALFVSFQPSSSVILWIPREDTSAGRNIL